MKSALGYIICITSMVTNWTNHTPEHNLKKSSNLLDYQQHYQLTYTPVEADHEPMLLHTK